MNSHKYICGINMRDIAAHDISPQANTERLQIADASRKTHVMVRGFVLLAIVRDRPPQTTQAREVAPMVDLGKLATVEFRDDGQDMAEAVGMLSTGVVTMPQFTAWQRLRDEYVAS